MLLVLVKAADPGLSAVFRHLFEKYGGPETSRGKACMLELTLSLDEN